ncbi:HD domain-containing protein [Antarctobacter sp.]|uniref:HD domain-containing protein n=1 Tax=Antarctobacter sp. TaxID=1872577 RepID=UPI002B2757FA|nr:HD domain-containing protein [Antarctobacter sp.]
MTHPTDRFDQIIAFLQGAQSLKETLRSGATSAGRRESVAAHSWGLCLLILLLEKELDGIDLPRLLKLCILHDLGEAISGDIPAIHQDPAVNKSALERVDFQTLCAPLPDDLRGQFLTLWDEYEAAETPEAQMAKGLDKLETMIQHVTGAQDSDFDYLWNLGYGNDRTNKAPLLRRLRAKVDAMTQATGKGQPR